MIKVVIPLAYCVLVAVLLALGYLVYSLGDQFLNAILGLAALFLTVVFSIRAGLKVK